MTTFSSKLSRCCAGAVDLLKRLNVRLVFLGLILGAAPFNLSAESLFSWTIKQIEPSAEAPKGLVESSHELSLKPDQSHYALKLPLKTMQAWDCKLYWKQDLGAKQVSEKLSVRCTTASREFRVTGKVVCAYRFEDRSWKFGETTFDLEAWEGRSVVGMATFQLRCDRHPRPTSGG